MRQKILDSLKARFFQGQPALQWVSLLALLALMVFGGFARLYHLDEKSLWSDEIATIATSQGQSVDPDAFRIRGKSFDPKQPVNAAYYVGKLFKGQSSPPLGRVSEVLKQNVHPPLFFWLMAWWTSLIGKSQAFSPFWLRLPAALAAVVTIPVFYGLALTLFRPIPTSDEQLKAQSSLSQGQQPSLVAPMWQTRVSALFATTLFTFSAYQINHAQDARPYSLLLLISLVCVWLVIGPIRQNRTDWRPWASLSVLLAMGLLLQYFFSIFSVFLLSYALLQTLCFPPAPASEPSAPVPPFPSRVEQRRGFILWLLGIGLTITILLPWRPYFMEQTHFLKLAGHYTNGLWRVGPLPEKLWRIICGFFMAESSWLKILPLVLLLVCILAWLFYRRRHPYHAAVEGRGLQTPVYTRALSIEAFYSFLCSWMTIPTLFIVLWLVLPLAGQLGLDLIKHSHTATIRRYLLLISPACYFLVTHGIFCLRRWIRRPWGGILSTSFAATFLVFMALDTGRYLFKDHLSSDEFKRAAQRVNHFYEPGDLVLVNKSGAMAVGMAYYLKPNIPMMGIDLPWDQHLLQVESVPIMDSVVSAIDHHKRVWLVFAHAAPSTVTYLGNWLECHRYYQVGLRRYSGVNVYQFQLKSPGYGDELLP